MKIEKIRNHKRIIVGGLITLGVITTLILTTSKAKYKNIQTMDLVNGTINYKPYDFKVMAMYKNDGSGDVEISEMPSSGYIINESKSYCTLDNTNKDTNATLKTIDGNHVIENLSKNDKCYLYFDKSTNLIATIKEGAKEEKTEFTGVATEADTGVYTAPDDYGTSYYFRGIEDKLNNWVEFAGFYWRIIRINGNGTIRMIYTGEASGAVSSNNKLGTTTQINNNAYQYNSSDYDNTFVGYMNNNERTTSYNKAHLNLYDSNAKKQVDSWYKTNIVDKGYGDKVDINTGFCNDRVIDNGTHNYTGDGYGTQTTSYAPLGRLYQNNNFRAVQTPTFHCSYIGRDFFTINNANIGNKKLTYPVGLITIDEAIFAGMFNGREVSSYYLETGQRFWTMSPHMGASDTCTVYIIGSNGQFGTWNGISKTYAGLRPVKNLKADTQFSGSGSESDPYKVI